MHATAQLLDYRSLGTSRARQLERLCRDVRAATETWRLAALGLRRSLGVTRTFTLGAASGWRWRNPGRPPKLLPIRAYGSKEDLDWARGQGGQVEDYQDLRALQVRDTVRAVAELIAAARALEAFQRRTGSHLSKAAADDLRLLATWRQRRRRLLGKAAAWEIVAREIGLSVSQLRKFARKRPRRSGLAV